MNDLFDRAREAVAIADLAGQAVKLVRSGQELRGPCPVCQAGAKSAMPPFAVNPAKGTFRCYGCEVWGDVVDLERRLRGGTPAEAARRLTGGGYETGQRLDARPPVAQGAGDESKALARLRLAQEMLDEARPIAGTLVERYLRGRGIPQVVIAAAAPAMLFHPFAKAGWDAEAMVWIKAPAMLVRPVTQDPETGLAVPTGGVHATYLKRDGSGRDKALGKKMWGPQHGPGGRPAGAWLIGPEAASGGFARRGSGMAVGEGVETVLSVVALQLRRGEALRACAALSLARLQGGEARDDEGCVDPYRAVPDPARPPFVWAPPAGGPWPEVLVAVDRDMSPVRVRGRTPRGRVIDYIRDGEVRARLCGHLAVQGWRAAGARAVVAIQPPPGSDFNDELRRLLALEKTA